MEHYFISSIEWASDNRFWLGPIVLIAVLSLMVWVGMALGRDVRDDLRDFRK